MAVLVKVLPQFLLRLFVPMLLLCLAAWAIMSFIPFVRKQVRPVFSFSDGRGRRLPPVQCVVIAFVMVVCTLFSGKNTNNVQNLSPRPMLQLPAPTPPSIFDYPRTVTETRAASGFALVGVGTNETFAFDPPAGAEVCADWRALGSFSRWTHVSPTNFAFPFGGTNATTFTFVPGGVAELAGGADAPRIVPFGAEMGIAPERYWGSLGVTSRFWTAASPSNTFLATWQGALLGRRADRPVDVQLELFPDGGFDFRYDLSRLASDGDLADARVAAWNAAGGETYSVPHRNLTSARWRHVAPDDAVDPDRDNDGVTTVDELFFLGTDPGNPDSDFDGLPDGQELTLGLDPLDPYSNGGPYSDGFSVALGGEDPLSCPPGSTNTVLEHVFYSGTTNGAFACPQPSDGLAVLSVTASGSGTGDLVVGSRVVPLVVPPPQRGGAPLGVPLFVLVPKGVRHRVVLRGDPQLEAAVDSGEFAIGEMPRLLEGDPSGWICFPRTRPVPEVACIHDLHGRKVDVRLEPGEGAEGIAASWWSSAAVAAQNHADGVSATLTGNFDASHTARVWYELVHPQYLFGNSYLPQSVRFCPRPSDADDEPEDEPEDDPDPDPDPPDDGNDDLYDGDRNEETDSSCSCCDHCGECSCHAGEAPPGVSGPVPTEQPDPEDPEAPPPDCPVHNCPYSECYELHEDNAPRTVTVPSSTHVLTIGRVPSTDTVLLAVPEGAVNCCPCPDHWTNYVGVAYKSGHLAVKGGDGLDFWSSETDCMVYVTGLTPTRAAAGAPLAFATNGAISVRRDYAVFGVDIDTPGGTAALLNALSPSFGIPMTVCTNASRAAGIDLVTRVRLAAGAVTLTAGGGAFKAWLDRSNAGQPPLLLVDGTTRPTVTMSLAKWRSLARLTGDENEARTRILLTSAVPGSRTLTFSFTAGGALTDSVTQNITFIKPPLRFDITRDGSIDEEDSAGWHNGRTFYYWINEDKFRGDRIDQGLNLFPNTWDFTVNGTFDLVNFFPVALDLSAFTAAWQGGVTYMVKPKWGNANTFNFCFADVPWNKAGSIQTTNITTTANQALSSASLTALPAEGHVLPYALLTSFSEGSGLMICEAKSEYASLQIDVKDGDTLLYRYYAPMTILPVKQMYSWYNFRHLSGEGRKRVSEHHVLLEEHNAKSLIFLHGANVSEDEAEVWGDVLFKRLWLSGMHANFYNVDWRSDIGTDANYHQNASNAFVVASQIVSTLANNVPGEKVIMAHSLGNMVVSSMIHDYELQVSKYLMCDSAVPSEAYYPANDVSIRVPQLVHPQWEAYPTNSWASNWHKLFATDHSDDRRKLGWPGRFLNVPNVAVNFYSTGDEVLELSDDNDIYVWTGITSGYVQYSWHHQELWKGRGVANILGGTTWSGWNIEANWRGEPKISPEQALQMDDADFKTNTVFYCYPSSMNSTNISLLVRAAHLTQGIPSLARPTGGRDLYDVLDWRDYFNMNLPVERQVGNDGQTITQGIQRPNGWPTRFQWDDRWLHSDMKDVSYFYNFKFYEKVVEKGEL